MSKVRIKKGEKDIVISFNIPEDLNSTEEVFYKYVIRQLVHLESVDGLAGETEIIDLDKFAEFIKAAEITEEDYEERDENVIYEEESNEAENEEPEEPESPEEPEQPEEPTDPEPENPETPTEP